MEDQPSIEAQRYLAAKRRDDLDKEILKEVTPAAITTSSLFARLRKLNPRQRNNVYRDMGFGYLELSDPKGALYEFFTQFGENQPVSVLDHLEKAISDASNETVLEPCIEELKKAVEALIEEERSALEYDKFDWRAYQGQFFDLKSLHEKTEEMLKSLPDDLKDYRVVKDFKQKCITSLSIIKRMERLPFHLRAYVYGRMGYKKLVNLDPAAALCKFAADYGAGDRMIDEGKVDSDTMKVLTFLDDLITKVEAERN
jgi:hypothetical protein